MAHKPSLSTIQIQVIHHVLLAYAERLPESQKQHTTEPSLCLQRITDPGDPGQPADHSPALLSDQTSHGRNYMPLAAELGCG